MPFGRQFNNTDSTITSRIVIIFSVLATILFLHLFLVQIKSIVCPGGDGVMRRDGRATEQGQWRA